MSLEERNRLKRLKAEDDARTVQVFAVNDPWEVLCSLHGDIPEIAISPVIAWRLTKGGWIEPISADDMMIDRGVNPWAIRRCGSSEVYDFAGTTYPDGAKFLEQNPAT